MPKVSIIIPTYNRATYLQEAVASALDQTFNDTEIIVVDDGSTDNTSEIVKKFPPKVQYFRQDNQGVSAARNNGIRRANGKYVCFLDSDDMLMSDAIEKNVSFLDLHPDLGYSYGQVVKVDENGQKMRLKKNRGASSTCVRTSNEQIQRLLFRGDIGILSALAKRSLVIEAGMFNTSMAVGEDIDLWLRLAQKYPVGYIAEPVGKVRMHPQNTLKKGAFEKLERFQTDFVARALETLKNDPLFEKIRKRAYFGLYLYLSGEAARKSSRVYGFRYLMKALSVYPGLALRRDGFSFVLDASISFLPQGMLTAGKNMLSVLKLR
jgi:glycosyltransferase involved in cell wall biosynthesis